LPRAQSYISPTTSRFDSTSGRRQKDNWDLDSSSLGLTLRRTVKARDLAGEANDQESQDLMVERITVRQKTIWMLKSFLKT
jgi:DNA-binding ferritin-like protein